MEQKGIQLLIVLVSIAFFFLVTFFIGLVSYLERKKMQFSLEKERDKLQFQEQLLLAEAEITEQNLKNVGWELHDNIGQLLSIASMELGMLMQHERVNKDELAEITALVKKSIVEVRSLSKTLNTDVIQSLGLIAMIDVERDRLERLGLIQVEFKHPEKVEIEQKNEVIIFRMIQEFINNSLKHAEASILRIEITEMDDQYSIIVADNGKGFSLHDEIRGTGLINLEKRATLIGADITFHSVLGVGTEMTISIG